jgi:hypothetical protein
LAETFHHKGLNLEIFKDHLTKILRNFVAQKDSVTGAVYNKLVQVTMPTNSDIQKVIQESGLPKKLALVAVERLREEEKMLETEANLWLVYNAANYALFNGKSALTINERFKADQKTFNNLAAIAL